MNTALVDGLYRVTNATLCAGFVVERGRITMCAPILRKRLAYWTRFAQRVTIVSTRPTTGGYL